MGTSDAIFIFSPVPGHSKTNSSMPAGQDGQDFPTQSHYGKVKD